MGEDGAATCGTLRLDARTGLGGLAAAQGALEAWLAMRGAGARMVDRAALVTEEVVLNIGTHGHGGGAGDGAGHPVGIAATLGADGALTLVFEDRARVFDPVAAPPPPRRAVPDGARLLDGAPLPDESPVGGMGLVLLRGLSDGLTHAPREGGGNRLTVVLRGDQVAR